MLKSRYFDKNRYEFDPNKTWSVLEQGRGFARLKAADEAVKLEMERLALERKNLVDSVKKLDEAMLALRAWPARRPRWRSGSRTCCSRWPECARASAWTARSNCMDYTAPPVDAETAVAGAYAGATIAVAAVPRRHGSGRPPARGRPATG